MTDTYTKHIMREMRLIDDVAEQDREYEIREAAATEREERILNMLEDAIVDDDYASEILSESGLVRDPELWRVFLTELLKHAKMKRSFRFKYYPKYYGIGYLVIDEAYKTLFDYVEREHELD